MEPSIPPLLLISWNVTTRCNLRCRHCYLDSTERAGTDELSSDEARRVVDDIASLNPNAMLILTGGEPLLRRDIFAVASYASNLGLGVVIGTNGTIVDEGTADRLKECRVKGVGISLDSASAAFHDGWRGLDGAWQGAVNAMRILKERSIDFQVQFTVTRETISQIKSMAALSSEAGAKALNIFFLVCTGRGRAVAELSPDEYETALEAILNVQIELEGKIIVRPRCAPHFLRVVAKRGQHSIYGGSSGCMAGASYLRITADGLVTPCPYIPAGPSSPSLRKNSLPEIWAKNAEFTALRRPEPDGRCGVCEWKITCGGCRARALASTGNLMDEDPLCAYKPAGDAPEKEIKPAWSKEAEARLERIPVFLRPMVKTGVEKYATAKGLREITPELMALMRTKAGR